MPNLKKGFTLIELLIGFVLMSIITAAVFGVLHVADVSWDTDMAQVFIQQQARQSMDSMMKEIRQSRPMDVGITVPGDLITFKVPIDIPITNYANVTYYLNNNTNQIIRENPLGSNLRVVANYVDVLNFCCLGGADCYDCVNATVVRMRVGVNETIKQRIFTFNLTEQGGLRNE